MSQLHIPEYVCECVCECVYDCVCMLGVETKVELVIAQSSFPSLIEKQSIDN